MRIFIIVFTLLLIVPSIGTGQSISVGFGPTFLVDKSDVALHSEVIGEGVGGNDDWILQISYSKLIKNRYEFDLSFSGYSDATFFNFKYGENNQSSYGWAATKIRRIDVGGGYYPFLIKNWIIKFDFNVGVCISKPTGIGIVGIIPKGGLPNDFEQLVPVEANSYKTTQLVPSIGLKLGYAFWNRLELFFDISQVWGHKRTQQLRLKYSYKGEVQPDAINFTDGTGRFYMMGIGYRFGKKWN